MGLYQECSWVKFAPIQWGSQVNMGLYRENFGIISVPSHKAKGYQILHVALVGFYQIIAIGPKIDPIPGSQVFP